MKTTRPTFPEPASPFTTSRLLIRPIKVEDLEDFHTLRTQLEVMKWTSTTKTDVDRAATRIWMDRYLPPNDSITFNFSIEELHGPGKVVGVIGSHVAEPPEVGYMLRTEMWGKGYATEALRAWLDVYWALPRKEIELQDEAHTGSESGKDVVREVLKADIDHDNVASHKVLEKCGFSKSSTEEVDENGTTVRIDTFLLERPF